MIKLLLIEDDHWTNTVMDIVLRESRAVRSYKIKTNGKEALEYLVNEDNAGRFPDLILVDLVMPVMNGFDFITEYEKRFWGKYPQCKLVVLSNSMLDLERVKFLEHKSVCDYLIKPLTTAKLKDIVYH